MEFKGAVLGLILALTRDDVLDDRDATQYAQNFATEQTLLQGSEATMRTQRVGKAVLLLLWRCSGLVGAPLGSHICMRVHPKLFFSICLYLRTYVICFAPVYEPVLQCTLSANDVLDSINVFVTQENNATSLALFDGIAEVVVPLLKPIAAPDTGLSVLAEFIATNQNTTPKSLQIMFATTLSRATKRHRVLSPPRMPFSYMEFLQTCHQSIKIIQQTIPPFP